MVAWLLPIAGAGATGEHPALTPETVTEVVFPGGEVEVEKIVHTPEIPPMLDFFLVVDLSGSYYDDLPNIQAASLALCQDIQLQVPDSQFGLATFVDYPYNNWGSASSGDYAYRLDQDLTGDCAVWDAAVQAMGTRDGGDGPESQYEALYQLATGAGRDVGDAGPSLGDIPAGLGGSFRTDSSRVAAITTDASFHTPGDSDCVSPAPCPFPYPGPDEDTTVDALNDAGISVVAIKAPGSGDEMDDLAELTGGAVVTTSNTSEEIAGAILEGLGNLPVNVEMVTDCAWPIMTTFDPAIQLGITSGDDAFFDEVIAVDPAAPGGTYVCHDWALIDGEEMLDETGALIVETKTIRVPEGYLTGGGQIGKGKKAQNFGGNVGYLADFSVVGQWNFRDGDLKLNMHSLSIDTLQFSNDAGPDPDPPAANAEVATFSGTARVKLGTAQWDYACSFVAQAHDHGEPDVADVFGIRITCDGDVWTYGREVLDTGNLQIHSGLKD